MRRQARPIVREQGEVLFPQPYAQYHARIREAHEWLEEGVQERGKKSLAHEVLMLCHTVSVLLCMPLERTAGELEKMVWLMHRTEVGHMVRSPEPIVGIDQAVDQPI